jgi:hypothetical protein
MKSFSVLHWGLDISVVMVCVLDCREWWNWRWRSCWNCKRIGVENVTEGIRSWRCVSSTFMLNSLLHLWGCHVMSHSHMMDELWLICTYVRSYFLCDWSAHTGSSQKKSWIFHWNTSLISGIVWNAENEKKEWWYSMCIWLVVFFFIQYSICCLFCCMNGYFTTLSDTNTNKNPQLLRSNTWFDMIEWHGCLTLLSCPFEKTEQEQPFISDVNISSNFAPFFPRREERACEMHAWFVEHEVPLLHSSIRSGFRATPRGGRLCSRKEFVSMSKGTQKRHKSV